MDPYLVVLAGFGFVTLLTAWLPMVLQSLPLSLPIFCVLLGIGIGLVASGDAPSPLTSPDWAEHLTELVVIVALLGAGLKLDRPIGWRSWMITWRLLGITMPLCIAAIAVAGWAMLGLPFASALLLAAALAPTDPVLASDVQVGPPGSGEEDEVRFSLTSEAGLNDGLAFPFVHLAAALALAQQGAGGDWVQDWLIFDVVWKLVAGIAFGWLIGKVLGYVTFRVPEGTRLSGTGDGLVALGITCLCYGLTELAHGYGFLAVFVAALALRDEERTHAYHQTLHDFSEQLERLLMMLLLVAFGITIAGGLLEPLTWEGAALGLAVLFVVRPLCGLAGLFGANLPLSESAVIGFFGIRGIGTFYYLAYGLNAAPLAEGKLLWAIGGFVVLVSVFVHGVTVTPVIRRLDKTRSPS